METKGTQMTETEYPGHTIHRYAISHGVSWEEAERRFDAFIAKAEARRAADQAELEAVLDDIESKMDSEITPETAAKLMKKLAKPLNKARRAKFIENLGITLWNEIANPQTRERGFAKITEGQALEILRVWN